MLTEAMRYQISSLRHEVDPCLEVDFDDKCVELPKSPSPPFLSLKKQHIRYVLSHLIPWALYAFIFMIG